MYQKMISYMYEYVNGEKGNNIGFAKIASQNQRYKIKIHIKNFALNGRALNVYGFVRGDGILYSSCLGSIKIVNGIGEGVFVGNTGELWEKYRFLDMSGLILCGASLLGAQEKDGDTSEKTALLQQEKARFCATQWEEGTIELEQLDIFQSRKKRKVMKIENDRQIGDKWATELASQAGGKVESERKTLQAAEAYNEYPVGGTSSQRREVEQAGENYFDYQDKRGDRNTDNQVDSTCKEFLGSVTKEGHKEIVMQDSVHKNARNEQWKNSMQTDQKEYIQVMEKEVMPVRGVTKEKAPVLIGARAMEQMETNDAAQRINVSSTLNDAPEKQKKQLLQYAEQQTKKEQNKQLFETEQENFIQNSEDNREKEDIWDLFEQRRKQIQLQFEEIKHGTSTERKGETKEENEDRTKWQPGENLLDNYPEMSPFFDNSVIASVRVEPKDIGVLPMEYWYLANNSFLLHGYYCYRHLLFMKMEMEQEVLYAIAVPGNSNYREKIMANMFGFEQFKPVQKKENAGFGYWWKRIF